jgi:predicted ATPase
MTNFSASGEILKIDSVSVNYFKGIRQIVLSECSSINVLVGKNNSGKSTVLHAIDMGVLAINAGRWDKFQPKLAIKDLFSDVGNFEIQLKFSDNSSRIVTSSGSYGPTVTPAGISDSVKSILIIPDPGAGLLQRNHRTPKWILEQVEARNFGYVNALEILYAIKFYSQRSENGFTPESYTSLINEVKNYFPDLSNIESDRTDEDIATLTYEEYGKKLDILYSGTGLKHFVDVLIKTTLSKANIVLLDEPEVGLHPDLQRRFLEYLIRLAKDKQIQFFIATHSPVFLNYSDTFSFFRITNKKGLREVHRIAATATHTLLSDFGIRPSDIFNQDICLLVEGASEVVFFEHVIRTLYKSEFEKIGVGVIQYGGDAAAGIVSGSIDVTNITPTQKYTFWVRDRDAKPDEAPATGSVKFKNALTSAGLRCHIFKKREIEFYYPEIVHEKAQQGDAAKITATKAIFDGDQSAKYRNAAETLRVCVPAGKYLRKLLIENLTSREQLDNEIRELIEQTLIPWKIEILGDP